MADHHATELIGYHDLDRRAAFKLAMQEVDGSFFLYAAHLWEPGLTILDVTDPCAPRSLRTLPGPANTWTIQVQVADQKMITSLEHIPNGWGGEDGTPPLDGFVVWDVSSPDSPVELGTWRSGGVGAHRNFYSGGRYVHAASGRDGFDGHHYVCVDIDDPGSPDVVGNWWWPGQAPGEEYSEFDCWRMRSGLPFPGQHSLSIHGAPYVLGDRAYCPWMRAGLVILDISDLTAPKRVGGLSFYPPLGSSIALHTAIPLPGRDLVLVNSEALNERGNEPVGFAGIVDVSNETDPVLISLFPQPRPPAGASYRSFVDKGGRFGPHNQHQPQGQPWLQPHDDHVYLTYFNAGLQIYDISAPTDPHIVASYIPDDPTTRRGPLPRDLVTQVEDVIVDRRGVIYLSEKNSGIHIVTADL